MASLSRSELREHIFKNVFCAGIREDESPDDHICLYLDFLTDENDEKIKISEKDGTYIKDKCKSVLDMKDELDSLISEYSKDWSLKRLGKVELAILRLALYELLYDEDIPENVAINEAVELAKKYGGEMTPGFVNGILSTAKQKAAEKT